MTTLKKNILTTVTSIALITSSSVYAAEETENRVFEPSKMDISLNGFVHFQSGFRSQSELDPTETNVSFHRDNFAFFNEAALVASASKKVEDISYGVKIVLSTTAKRKGSNSYNGSHLYLSSSYGRLELGSSASPASTMMLDAGCITSGSGNWGRYANKKSLFQQQAGVSPSFASGINFFLGDYLTSDLDNRSYSNEPSRSMVYYSPKFSLTDSTKMSIGLAYTPDSSNTGADNITTQSSGLTTYTLSAMGVDRFEFDRSVKDAISGAVAFDHAISDGIDFQMAGSFEFGKSSGFAKEYALSTDTTPTAVHSLSNLTTYNVGASLSYGNFAYAASYGSLGQSLTTDAYHRAGRDTNYYTAAISYKQGPCSISLDYFGSEQFKNTVNAVTIGTNYKPFDGAKMYFEVTRYTLDGRPEFYPALDKREVSGTAVIGGLKLTL